MFSSREDQLVFMNYAQKLIEKPRYMDEQPCQRQGQFMWCDDWEIIELLKYFFNGHDGYLGDPPPNRLVGNPFFSKENIVQRAKGIIDELKTPTAIVEYFIKRREDNHAPKL